MTITLQLNNKEITVNTRDIEGQELYRAQDLLQSHYENSKDLSTTLKAWVKRLKFQLGVVDSNGSLLLSAEESKIKLTRNGVVNKEGRNGGTYLTRDNLLKLAGYVSYEFEDAVYKAFGLLVEGKTEEARSIAQTVASFHRENARNEYKNLSSKITATVDEGLYSFSKYGNLISFRNFNNLLWKYATNTPLPKPSPSNLRDALVTKGLADEALRLDVGTQMLIGLLNAKQPYDTIKLVMGIK
ncbi:TPA: hypothetical protein ACPVXB_005069 [Vibrio parahaemolyticus]